MPKLAAGTLVTGANGHLGRQLLEAFMEHPETHAAARAAVRSQRAARSIRALPGADAVDLRVLDYSDADSLEEAVTGCGAVVHLVGIIKQSSSATYQDAHERSCESLVRAATAAGVERIVYLSIVGAHPDSENACLASKAAAEQILRDGRVPACVLRVPMVLGRGDPASRSLRSQARARLLPQLGGGRTLQQPIDAADVIAAICAVLHSKTPLDCSLDLAGPECLTHRELVQRAAALHANHPRVVPIPLAVGRLAISLLERLLANPPLTLSMLEVLQHDDRVDPGPACKQLGIELTALDDTLRDYVGPQA
jgi:NADH dehydrogenase